MTPENADRRPLGEGGETSAKKSRPSLVDSVTITTLPDGTRAMILEAAIPDDAPQQVREGLARRAIVSRGGACPCGARMVLPSRAQRRKSRNTGRPMVALIEHEDDCPAVTEALVAAVRAWREAAS